MSHINIRICSSNNRIPLQPTKTQNSQWYHTTSKKIHEIYVTGKNDSQIFRIPKCQNVFFFFSRKLVDRTQRERERIEILLKAQHDLLYFTIPKGQNVFSLFFRKFVWSHTEKKRENWNSHKGSSWFPNIYSTQVPKFRSSSYNLLTAENRERIKI